jgi:hypothetical protein
MSAPSARCTVHRQIVFMGVGQHHGNILHFCTAEGLLHGISSVASKMMKAWACGACQQLKMMRQFGGVGGGVRRLGGLRGNHGDRRCRSAGGRGRFGGGLGHSAGGMVNSASVGLTGRDGGGIYGRCGGSGWKRCGKAAGRRGRRRNRPISVGARPPRNACERKIRYIMNLFVELPRGSRFRASGARRGTRDGAAPATVMDRVARALSSAACPAAAGTCPAAGAGPAAIQPFAENMTYAGLHSST